MKVGGWVSMRGQALAVFYPLGHPGSAMRIPEDPKRFPNPALGIFQLDLSLGHCSAGQQFLVHLYSKDDLRFSLI